MFYTHENREEGRERERRERERLYNQVLSSFVVFS